MTATLDIAKETPLSLAAAAKRLPRLRAGRPLHPATVLRWILDGVRGRDGDRIRLEAVRIGGRWCTSAEALQRFLATLSAAPAGPAGPAPRTAGQRQRAAERAGRELDKLGIA
jgi:hypothetical protein